MHSLCLNYNHPAAEIRAQEAEFEQAYQAVLNSWSPEARLAAAEARARNRGGVLHLGEDETALSILAHKGNTHLNLKQTKSTLHGTGLKLSDNPYPKKLLPASHKFAKVLNQNGHDKNSVAAIGHNANQVRTALVKVGWRHTHVHNVPSLAGGKNHQEMFTKGPHVATTVDYGYGDTTIKVSKKHTTENTWTDAARKASAAARAASEKTSNEYLAAKARKAEKHQFNPHQQHRELSEAHAFYAREPLLSDGDRALHKKAAELHGLAEIAHKK